LDTYASAGITEEVATEVREAFSDEAFREILSANSTFITVAVHNGALVGFSQTTIGAHQDLAPPGAQAELERLYVQEPFANRRVGSRLLQEHEAVAARHGATVLWLSAWVGNRRARRFYLKCNYEDCGLVFFHMGQHKVENRVYAKLLAIAA
jgi:ribosomal protein S18 acetylase RimI-like enzyme